MINEYKKYINDKGDNNFWKKAKQHEYNDSDKIIFSLQNFRELTTRNSISLRILGLIKNLGNDRLEITEAGTGFLKLENKQEILDEQLLKIYLDSEINNRLNIPVFPLGIIYSILYELEYITFEEYKIFICWVNNNNEVKDVINFIKKYRLLGKSEKEEINKIFNKKITELKIDNFNDNIYRLFKMFTLTAYLHVEGNRFEEIIYRNCKPSTYQSLLNSLQKIKIEDYINDLTHYKKIITQKSDYDDILNPIHSLSNEDRNILLKQITEKKSLPDIREIVPSLINPKIIERKNIIKNSRKNSAKKIDYLARDTRNRLVGLHAEKIVYKYEYNRLVKIGKNDLAQGIVHESLTNDNLGYDITSYDVVDGKTITKHIEVKAVNGLPRTFSFFISKNELDKVKNDPSHEIYIVFNYETKDAQIWPLPHLFSDEKIIEINPVKFQVTLTIER